MSELAATLRARGMRLTPQRRRILDALAALGHGTPEQVAAHLTRDGGEPVPLSTVYRSLHALGDLGAVSHTHLGHGAPTYQLAEHGPHVHLVCRGCGAVDEVPATAAAGFVELVERERGFRADVAHLAVHGRCADCTGVTR